MSKPRSVSIRLDPELDDRLSSVADNLERSRSWVIEQANQGVCPRRARDGELIGLSSDTLFAKRCLYGLDISQVV
jgi:hypothetical protein